MAHFSLRLELGGMVEQNLIDQFILQNTPLLNPNILRRKFVANAYVLMIAISLPDGEVKPGDPLDLFYKSRQMSARGYRLRPFSPHIHHTLQHNIWTHTLILAIFSYLDTSHPAMWSDEMGLK